MPVFIIIALLALILFFMVSGFVMSFLLFSVLPWILLGLLSGWVGSKIVGANTTLGEDIIAGVVGSVIAGALFSIVTHSSAGGVLSPVHILVSIVGATVVLAVNKAMQGNNKPMISAH